MSDGSLTIKADVLRQLLQECPTGVIQDLLGISDGAVDTLRETHGIPNVWRGQHQSLVKAASRVLRERWRHGPQSPPDPITQAKLMEMAVTNMQEVAEAAKDRRPGPLRVARPKQEAPMIRPKPTMETVAALLRRTCEDHDPTVEELATAGNWDTETTRSILFNLRRLDRVEKDLVNGTYKALPERATTSRRDRKCHASVAN